MAQDYPRMVFRIEPSIRDRTKKYLDGPTERSSAMAEKETPKAEEKHETAAERRDREEKAAEKEAERAEKQRQLAQRLQYGPIRDSE